MSALVIKAETLSIVGAVLANMIPHHNSSGMQSIHTDTPQSLCTCVYVAIGVGFIH